MFWLLIVAAWVVPLVVVALVNKSRQRSIGDPFMSARFTVHGHPVVCPHCGNDRFLPGTGLINTLGLTFLGLDWANRQAYTLACTKCSAIYWFRMAPDRERASNSPE